MTKLADLPTIIPAIDGDYLTMPELRGKYCSDHVRADCGTRATAFVCLSCRVVLANQYQLELHSGDLMNNRHVVAKLCDLQRHGAEALTV